MKTKLPNLLRATRAKLGLSIRQICTRGSLARNSVCQWEKGSREPRIHQLEQIATAYGLSRERLFAALSGVSIRATKSKRMPSASTPVSRAVDRLTG